MSKIRIFFLALTVTSVFSTVKTFGMYDVLDLVANAIKSGNADVLAQYFDSSVDVTVIDKEAVYSKAQAQMVIKDFFMKNPVNSFSLVHRGTSSEGSQYGIGNMTSGANSFRVYFLVRNKTGASLIKEIRFERQ